jgi:folate-binding Fe-S cluster repair protein YgfZ
MIMSPMNPPLILDGAVRLSHWGLVRAQGDDAAAFLHGQLSNDFALLGLSQARLAAYCSPKGRMLASFVAFKRSPSELWMACDAQVLPAALKRLSMFVLRAKCKLSDASAQ